ncbi:hypothetical protein ABIA33_006645 [Streptacidiphilus sp. MAP12-16]|uniref:hypothetical protein n=1 Tax=Streptacidiphilus sp. MAP12-16 TaxID=3156300 RepID=UPI003516E73D
MTLDEPLVLRSREASNVRTMWVLRGEFTAGVVPRDIGACNLLLRNGKLSAEIDTDAKQAAEHRRVIDEVLADHDRC